MNLGEIAALVLPLHPGLLALLLAVIHCLRQRPQLLPDHDVQTQWAKKLIEVPLELARRRRGRTRKLQP